MADIFFEKNLEIKNSFLQEEHKAIIQAVYRDAVDKDCVTKNYKLKTEQTQCMKYTEIAKATQMEPVIIITCLTDLVGLGLLANVMINTNNEYSYGITWLGLKYIEYMDLGLLK